LIKVNVNLIYDFITSKKSKISDKVLNLIWPLLEANNDVLINSVANDGIFQMFLDKGIDVNIKTGSGLTPLHILAKQDNAGNVKELINRGAKTDSKENAQNNTLFYAFAHKNYDVIKLLTENGADPSQTNNKGINHIHEAVINDDVTMLELLRPEPDNGELMTKAIKHSSLNAAKHLITIGFNPDVKDRFGNNLIIRAVMLKKTELLRFFLKQKLDINVQNLNKETSLLWAIKNRQNDIANVLLARRIDVNIRDAEGDTALHYACRYNEVNLVEKLLKKKANPLLKNNNNRTPLQIALQYDRSLIARRLLQHINETTDRYKKVKVLS